jgi:hypothetical protein
VQRQRITQFIPLIRLVMPHPSNSNVRSDDEESFCCVSSGFVSSEDEVVEDKWDFPVVEHGASPREFRKVRE